MRVAHFIHRYPPALGGAEAVFARLGRYLVSQGDQVSVFTSNALDLESFWDRRARQLPPGKTMLDGVAVTRYPLRHAPFHRYVFKVLSLIPIATLQMLTLPFNPILPRMWQESGRAEQPFDVVHASAFPYSFPLACARRLARRLGVPFLITPFVHTGDPDDPNDRTRRGYTRPVLIDLARSADRIFVQTEGERLALLEHGIAPERLVLQGLGVDLPGCTGGNREKARARWGVSAGAVVVGHLANNSVEKGSVDLLQAAQLAWSCGGRFAVVLAGPTMPNYRAFRERFQPGGTLVELGPLDDEEKRDFFAALDVFALPSRSDSFGLVLPEAWANGAPCIGYRAGGVPWVIRDGSDGLLVRAGDVSGLAEALQKLVEDVSLRQRLGQSGRARLAGEFDWESKLRLVRETCLRAIEERRAKAQVCVAVPGSWSPTATPGCEDSTRGFT
jgi:glycosyltransferase involved in cell wall biosynthesis